MCLTVTVSVVVSLRQWSQSFLVSGQGPARKRNLGQASSLYYYYYYYYYYLQYYYAILFPHRHGTKIVARSLQFFDIQRSVSTHLRRSSFMLDEPVAGHWAYWLID